MTADAESEAGPDARPSPAFEIVGDPSVGLCVDGVCEVPDPTPADEAAASDGD